MKRAALIVGVNRYEDPDINKLEYAENDAIKLSGFLENRCLYNEVIPLLNPDAKTMLEVAGSMAGRLSAGDLLLLYFAGHGVRYAQQEVLLLPKARYDELDYYQDAVPLGLLKKKTRREGLNRAIVLDTCRTELLSGQRGPGSGMMRDVTCIKEAASSEKGDGGLAILCSCDEGQQSREVSDCRQGLFSLSFIESIKEGMDRGSSVYFSDDLSRAIAGRMGKIGERYGISVRQRPWISISGELPALIEGVGSDTVVAAPSPPPPLVYEHAIERVSAPKREEHSKDLSLIIPGSGNVQLNMKLIPAGSFLMGAPSSEKERFEFEGPQHKVTISKPFYMGIYPVTQAQWQAVMGSNPSRFKGADNPVDNVSWIDCYEFILKINKKGIGTFRLPTEAEWEYACRAGSATRFPWGDDPDYALLRKYAWCDDNSKNGPHPVGQKKPNSWGLYDMHGNVNEWCGDRYESYAKEEQTDPKGSSSGHVRVLRGGGWYNNPWECRSASRDFKSQSDNSYDVGFRLVRAIY